MKATVEDSKAAVNKIGSSDTGGVWAPLLSNLFLCPVDSILGERLRHFSLLTGVTGLFLGHRIR